MLRDKDDEGSTPLLLGVGGGKIDVVQVLLEHDANVNEANNAKVS